MSYLKFFISEFILNDLLNFQDKKGSLFSGNTIEMSSPDPEILKWIQERMERVAQWKHYKLKGSLIN